MGRPVSGRAGSPAECRPAAGGSHGPAVVSALLVHAMRVDRMAHREIVRDPSGGARRSGSVRIARRSPALVDGRGPPLLLMALFRITEDPGDLPACAFGPPARFRFEHQWSVADPIGRASLVFVFAPVARARRPRCPANDMPPSRADSTSMECPVISDAPGSVHGTATRARRRETPIPDGPEAPRETRRETRPVHRLSIRVRRERPARRRTPASVLELRRAVDEHRTHHPKEIPWESCSSRRRSTSAPSR
jgi:hypothetical protein